MKMRKNLAFLLVFVMLVSLFPANVFAATPYTTSGNVITFQAEDVDTVSVGGTVTTGNTFRTNPAQDTNYIGKGPYMMSYFATATQTTTKSTITYLSTSSYADSIYLNNAGDYAEYNLENVPAGVYSVSMHIASSVSTSHDMSNTTITIGGKTVAKTANVSLGKTSQVITYGSVSLSAGNQTMRIAINSTSDLVIDYIKLTRTAEVTPTPTPTPQPTPTVTDAPATPAPGGVIKVEGEEFDSVTNFKRSSTVDAINITSVEINTAQDNKEEKAVSNMGSSVSNKAYYNATTKAGSGFTGMGSDTVFTYRVNVASAGQYTLKASIASYQLTPDVKFWNNIQFAVNNAAATQTTTVTEYTERYKFIDIEYGTVNLAAGENTITLSTTATWAEAFIDYFTFTPVAVPTTEPTQEPSDGKLYIQAEGFTQFTSYSTTYTSEADLLSGDKDTAMSGNHIAYEEGKSGSTTGTYAVVSHLTNDGVAGKWTFDAEPGTYKLYVRWRANNGRNYHATVNGVNGADVNIAASTDNAGVMTNLGTFTLKATGNVLELNKTGGSTSSSTVLDYFVFEPTAAIQFSSNIVSYRDADLDIEDIGNGATNVTVNTDNYYYTNDDGTHYMVDKDGTRTDNISEATFDSGLTVDTTTVSGRTGYQFTDGEYIIFKIPSSSIPKTGYYSINVQARRGNDSDGTAYLDTTINYASGFARLALTDTAVDWYTLQASASGNRPENTIMFYSGVDNEIQISCPQNKGDEEFYLYNLKIDLVEEFNATASDRGEAIHVEAGDFTSYRNYRFNEKGSKQEMKNQDAEGNPIGEYERHVFDIPEPGYEYQPEWVQWNESQYKLEFPYKKTFVAGEAGYTREGIEWDSTEQNAVVLRNGEFVEYRVYIPYPGRYVMTTRAIATRSHEWASATDPYITVNDEVQVMANTAYFQATPEEANAGVYRDSNFGPLRFNKAGFYDIRIGLLDHVGNESITLDYFTLSPVYGFYVKDMYLYKETQLTGETVPTAENRSGDAFAEALAPDQQIWAQLEYECNTPITSVDVYLAEYTEDYKLLQIVKTTADTTGVGYTDSNNPGKTYFVSSAASLTTQGSGHVRAFVYHTGRFSSLYRYATEYSKTAGIGIYDPGYDDIQGGERDKDHMQYTYTDERLAELNKRITRIPVASAI